MHIYIYIHTHIHIYCLHIHFARRDLMMIGGNMHSRLLDDNIYLYHLDHHLDHHQLFLQIGAQKFVRIAVNRRSQGRGLLRIRRSI